MYAMFSLLFLRWFIEFPDEQIAPLVARVSPGPSSPSSEKLLAWALKFSVPFSDVHKASVLLVSAVR